MKELKEFQTETKELLNLMINSIYSNKDIFLREIISNASDAIDKYKYLSLTNSSKYPTADYAIQIIPNKEERSLTIVDNGIGMTKNEVISNLGTIAKSGSKEFLSKLKDAKNKNDMEIIGQFGVGFYSSFMVAKKVEVRTRSLDDTSGYLFTSDGVDSYSLEEIDKANHGSEVKIFLKDDTEDENYSKYLEEYEIEDLVKKYSDYIRYPIKMEVTNKVAKKDKDGKEIPNEFEEQKETKTLNSMVPLWKKPKSQVSDEDLNNFYKNKFNDYEDPFFSLYIKAEGLLEYNALIFVPSHAPYNLYSENYEKGLDLYVKGVFIKDHAKELVPDYLKFIKGLVDSDDFSLNVSREILQASPILSKIANNIEKKVVDKLKEIKEKDFEKYLKIYKVYGEYFKFGIYSSYGQKKDLLQDLLVFKHLNDEKEISFKDYKEKMSKDQKFIYYATGDSLEAINLLPQLEKYKKDKIDVLYLTQPIDEFALMALNNYENIQFKAITDASSQDDLSAEEKSKLDTLNAEHKRILDDVKEALKDKVDDVVFSTKLVDSPVCLESKDGLSLNMEKVLKEQPGANPDQIKANKVLEINPDHDLFKAIVNLKDDEEIKKYGNLLYDEAMLLQGMDIKDKKGFVENLNSLMLKSIK